LTNKIIPLQASALGDYLQEVMEDQQVTPKLLGEQINKSVSMVSRYLSGESQIPADVFLQIMDFLDIRDRDERQELIEQNRTARDFGWIVGFSQYVNSLANNVKLEGSSKRIRDFALAVPSGFTQPEAVARTLIGAGPDRDDPVKVDRQVEVRMLRGKLTDEPGGPTFQFLLHESILRMRIGSDEVMASQLRYWLELQERENIEIRVLPETSWQHVAVGIVTGFTLYDLEGKLPAALYIDSSTGSLYKQDPDIESFKTNFDALWRDVALTPEQSTARIHQELERIAQEKEVCK
jgi:transcriptional regulator with XRE-family HTH domain